MDFTCPHETVLFRGRAGTRTPCCTAPPPSPPDSEPLRRAGSRRSRELRPTRPAPGVAAAFRARVLWPAKAPQTRPDSSANLPFVFTKLFTPNTSGLRGASSLQRIHLLLTPCAAHEDERVEDFLHLGGLGGPAGDEGGGIRHARVIWRVRERRARRERRSR